MVVNQVDTLLQRAVDFVDQNKLMYYVYDWGKFETHFRESTETDVKFC